MLPREEIELRRGYVRILKLFPSQNFAVSRRKIAVHRLALRNAKDVALAAFQICSKTPVGASITPCQLCRAPGIQAKAALLGCRKQLLSALREWERKFPAFLLANVINLSGASRSSLLTALLLCEGENA